MASPHLHALPLPRHIDGLHAQRLFSRMATWVRQFSCGLSGHDALPNYKKDRLSLRCVTCGHESPGWELTARPPRPVAAGDAQRHRLVGPRLVRSKIA